MFTIYDDDIYVGVIGFESYSCDPTSAWLAWTFVIPDMRNKGYGKVAFNILMNILKTKCYKKFYIDSVEDKNTVAFYTKLDFKYIGTCKEFRQIHSQYSKEILIYNDNPVFVMDLENL
jgi:GNAT superfamily N-acetyltransferase